MDLSAFYDELVPVSENEKRLIDTFREAVIAVFGDDDQDFENLQKVCLLFYGKRSTLSKSQYYQKRKLICRLYNWLLDRGVVSSPFVKRVDELKLRDVVSDGEMYRFYFKSLDDVLDFVGVVGRMNGLDDSDDLLNIKTIIVLSWYQVDISEMLGLHKSGLHAGTFSVSIDGSREVHIPSKHFNVLKRFAELDVHKGFPSGKTQFYKQSIFLMRSAQRSNFAQNNIKDVVHRFNAVAYKYGKEISLLKLRRNALFCQVHMTDGSKSTNIVIRDIIGCDRAFAFGYKELYERWKVLILGGDAN